MTDVVRDLRRARRERRLGDVEWFDVAYRVYLAAFFGGTAVIIASDYIGDEALTTAQFARFLDLGPGVAGVLAAVALALGLRSGADGGPVAIEAADVRHLLLAPVDRRSVLARPVSQRMRTVAFTAAILGAIAGELGAQRLPGSGAAWTASGALAGGALGAAYVAVATIAHALRLPRWGATAIGAALVGWQAVTALGAAPGPLDTFGSLALWGTRQHGIDVAVPLATAALAVAALAWSGRLELEALMRRGDLVSQLRFAVTTQDLRTVVLLRRQLRNEQFRARPWLRLPAGRSAAVWWRGWHGLTRFPIARIGRMAALAATAGACAVAVERGTTPLIVGAGLALFLLGLEAIEPLSQEVDHPDRTDALVVPRGRLLVLHLLAPAAALVPFALIAAGTVAVLEPSAWTAALALAIPVTWAASAGAVISTVRDLADSTKEPMAMLPPEITGMTTVLKILLPIALSILATTPVLAMRELPEPATAVRTIVALALFVAVTLWWVRRGDDWRAKFRAFTAAGRAT